MIPWLKIGIGAAALLALGIAVHLWDAREKALGAAKVEAADAKALAVSARLKASQALADAQTNKDAVSGLQKERDALAAALAKPQPHLVCHSTGGGGQTVTTPSVADGTQQTAPAGGPVTVVRDGDQSGVDVSTDVRLIAAVGEALASQNRALLAREHGLETRGPEVAPSDGPR